MESSSQIIVRFCNLLQKVPTTQRSFKIDKVSSRECYIYINILFTWVHKLKINWEQSITCEVLLFIFSCWLYPFAFSQRKRENLLSVPREQTCAGNRIGMKSAKSSGMWHWSPQKPDQAPWPRRHHDNPEANQQISHAEGKQTDSWWTDW